MNNPFDFFMQQAQKFPEMMKDLQKELATIEVIGEAGAGLVRVVMNGHYLVKDLTIDHSLPPEVVRDLLLSAMNVASKKVAEAYQEKLAQLMKSCGLPEGFNFPMMPFLFPK